MERLSFYGEISRNKRSSVFLIFFVLVVLFVLVYVISLVVDPVYASLILVFGSLFTILYVVLGYYNADKVAIASVGAKIADPVKYRLYHDTVEGLCLASGLPKPRLFVMSDSQINAFASGRDPDHAVICVTSGCLEKLSKHELEGVLAHELSHIANFDIRFMTLTAVLVGMVSLIAQMFLRSLWWGGMGSRDDRGNNNALFLIIGVVLAVLAPLIVSLVQLAISRKREFAADASGVKFVRSPTGLISALEKIKANKPMRVSGAIAPLFLAKPNKSFELFQTHPSLDKRIERLKRM